MKSFTILFMLLTSSCSLFAPKPSNEIDALAEEVIKKHAGVDIRVTPVDAEKSK